MIREATALDEDRIVHLAIRFLETTPYGKLIPYNESTIRTLIGTILQMGAVFVAEDKAGTVVGMIALVVIPSPISGELYAEEIAWFVEPEHRGGTVGPRLMGVAERWAATNGANLFKMVAPSGTDVGDFYARRGYVATETSYVKVFPRA